MQIITQDLFSRGKTKQSNRVNTQKIQTQNSQKYQNTEDPNLGMQQGKHISKAEQQ